MPGPLDEIPYTARRPRRTESDEITKVVDIFLSATEETCVKDFWARRLPLVRTVVYLSIAGKKPRLNSSHAVSFHDNQEAENVLKACRRVIKEAIESHSVDCLCVGIHSIRAVALSELIRIIKHQESVIKILYHIIVTCAEVYKAMDQNYGTDNERVILYALAAFEFLGMVMKETSYSVISVHRRVRFISLSFIDNENEEEYQASLFCVPHVKKMGSGKLKSDVDMTPDILFTIASTSILTVSRLLWTCQKLKKHPTLFNDSISFGSELPLQPDFDSHPPTFILAYLLYSVLSKWVFWIKSEQPVKCDLKLVKEIVSCGKQAHLILWEIANLNISENTNENLRQKERAIACLCCWGNDGSAEDVTSRSIADKIINDGYWDKACVVANISSKTFYTKLAISESSHALQRFHSKIGSLLDSFASSSFALNKYTSAYSDYCISRANHEGRYSSSSGCACEVQGISCLLAKSPFHFVHLDCHRNQEVAGVTLAFLAISVRDQLEGGKKYHNHGSIFEDSTRIIKNFESAILEPHDNISVDSIRLFRMLWSIKLHVVIASASQALPVGKLKSCYEFSLIQAAEIATKCVGPIAALSTIEADDKLTSNLNSAVFESFSGSISLYETLSNYHVSNIDNFEIRSNKSIQSFVRIIESTCESREGIERAAKFLSLIARRRQDSNGNPVVPLLHSLKLFLHLGCSFGFSEHQFCSRWSWLASIYTEQKLIKEAIVATALALNFDAMECESNLVSESTSLPMFRFLCSRAKGLISLGPYNEPLGKSSNQRNGLVAKLVSLLMTAEPIPMYPSITSTFQASAELIVKSLLSAHSGTTLIYNEALKQEMTDSFSLSSTLAAAFSCSSSSISTTSPDDGFSKLIILIQVLERFGNKLQTPDNLSSSENSSIRTFSTIVQFGDTFVRAFGCNDDELQVLLSVFYVLSSISLVSHHPLFDFDRWNLDRRSNFGNEIVKGYSSLLNFSSNLLSKALNLIQESMLGRNRDWLHMGAVLRQVINIQQFQLNSMSGGDKAHVDTSSIFSTMDHLCLTLSESRESSDVREMSRWLFVSLLSRVCDSLAGDGEKLTALQVSVWNRSVAKELTGYSFLWFEATTLSLQSLETMMLLEDVDFREGEEEVSTSEFEATLLQMGVKKTSDRDKLLNVCGRLKSLLAFINESLRDEQRILLLWSKTSALLGLSEASKKLMRYDESIRYAGLCFQACRELSRSMRINNSCVKSSHFATVENFKSSHFATVENLAGLTLLTRSSMRQVACLKNISESYVLIGDRSKACAYAEAAMNLVYSPKEKSFQSMNLREFIDFSTSEPVHSTEEIQCRRLIFRNKALKTAWDQVLDQLRDSWRLCLLPQVSDSLLRCTLNQELEIINDANSILNFMSDGHRLIAAETIQAQYEEFESSYNQFLRSNQLQFIAAPYNSQIPCIVPMLFFKLKLTRARRYLLEYGCGIQEDEARSACEDVIDSSSDCESRSYALYYLGLIELQRARISGELSRLWSGFSNLEVTESIDQDVSCDSFLRQARNHFSNLVALIWPTLGILSRDAVRCLALVTGPCSTTTAELIHTSIGSGARQGAVRRSQNNPVTTSFSMESEDDVPPKRIASVLRALDYGFGEVNRDVEVKSFFSKLERLLPSEWRVVACALCPTGELLITSLQLDNLGDINFTSVCIFPDYANEIACHASVYDSVLAPLDKIMQSNHNQLEEHALERKSAHQWWCQRNDIDVKLQNLISLVERKWFGCKAAQTAIIGSGGTDCDLRSNTSAAGHHFCTNLSEKFESVAESPSCSIGDESVETKLLGSSTILILDENMHRFPFEGMSCFDGIAVCRQLSLPFLLAKLMDLCEDEYDINIQQPCVHLERISYVLDPESNLPDTLNRLEPFLLSLKKNLDATWHSVTGEAPTKEFWQNSLTRQSGMLMFFGHGNGKKYFSQSDVDRLRGSLEHGDLERRVNSAIVLMGCSSGRLESVNRRDTAIQDQQLPIYYEPEGIALSYIAAGSPCVIGNLWDVTDRDIDAFTMSMIERFVSDGSHTSLAECVAQARSSCKLRYLIGCAPVCYGIPVFCNR